MTTPDTELAYGQIDLRNRLPDSCTSAWRARVKECLLQDPAAPWTKEFLSNPDPIKSTDGLGHLDFFNPTLSQLSEYELEKLSTKNNVLLTNDDTATAIDTANGWLERDDLNEEIKTDYRKDLATLLYWFAAMLATPKTWEERSDVATALVWCISPELLGDGKVSLASVVKSGQCHTGHAARLSTLTGRIRKELGDVQLHGKMKTAGARAKLCKGQQARRSTESKQPAHRWNRLPLKVVICNDGKRTALTNELRKYKSVR